MKSAGGLKLADLFFQKTLGWKVLSKQMLSLLDEGQKQLNQGPNEGDNVFEYIRPDGHLDVAARDGDLLMLLESRLPKVDKQAAGRQIWYFAEEGWDAVLLFYGSEVEIISKIKKRVEAFR